MRQLSLTNNRSPRPSCCLHPRSEQRRREAAERHAVAEAEAKATEAAVAAIGVPSRPASNHLVAALEGAAGVAQAPTLRKLRTARLASASRPTDAHEAAIPLGWRSQAAPSAAARSADGGLSEGADRQMLRGIEAPSIAVGLVPVSASGPSAAAAPHPTPNASAVVTGQNPFPQTSRDLLLEVRQQQLEEEAMQQRPPAGPAKFTRAPSQEEVIHLLQQIHPDNRAATQNFATKPFPPAAAWGAAEGAAGAASYSPTKGRPSVPVTRSASREAKASAAPGQAVLTASNPTDVARAMPQHADSQKGEAPRARKKWSMAPTALVLPLAGQNSPVAPPPAVSAIAPNMQAMPLTQPEGPPPASSEASTPLMSTHRMSALPAPPTKPKAPHEDPHIDGLSEADEQSAGTPPCPDTPPAGWRGATSTIAAAPTPPTLRGVLTLAVDRRGANEADTEGVSGDVCAGTSPPGDSGREEQASAQAPLLSPTSSAEEILRSLEQRVKVRPGAPEPLAPPASAPSHAPKATSCTHLESACAAAPSTSRTAPPPPPATKPTVPPPPATDSGRTAVRASSSACGLPSALPARLGRSPSDATMPHRTNRSSSILSGARQASSAGGGREATEAIKDKEDPVTRQMIDKRTSRRNNRESFVASIAAWRDELHARKPLSHVSSSAKLSLQSEPICSRVEVQQPTSPSLPHSCCPSGAHRQQRKAARRSAQGAGGRSQAAAVLSRSWTRRFRCRLHCLANDRSALVYDESRSQGDVRATP